MLGGIESGIKELNLVLSNIILLKKGEERIILKRKIVYIEKL